MMIIAVNHLVTLFLWQQISLGLPVQVKLTICTAGVIRHTPDAWKIVFIF